MPAANRARQAPPESPGSSFPPSPRTIFSIAPARAASVGAAKISRTDTGRSKASRSFAAASAAASEWPPSSKKSSSAPTRSTPNTWLQTTAISRSNSVRGSFIAVSTGSAAAPANGSAPRSTLPFGKSGRASRKTNSAGIMESGSRSFKNNLNSAVVGRSIPLTTYATRT